ncbi:hypothetical protein BC937DRAFT_94602 [Endogone sp. FLAS-F59071]|nr:hypothetical protein BC937DRAFT_94602 [Endogone sp. FLAS-F59071]|eukprot:RUS13920.1 hypothetical protein BC937DRAFT_94602 [Endogone sp. FLAS-F59071]
MNFYRLYNPIRPTVCPHAEWLLLRPLSTTSVRRTTMGYGDMWDKKDNRPNHGEFRENKSPNDNEAQGNQAQGQAQPEPQKQQDRKQQSQQQKQREQDEQQGLQPRKDESTNHKMLLEHDRVDKEEYVSGDFWAGDVGGKRGKHDEFLEVDDDFFEKIARDRAATDAEHFPTDEDVGLRQ